MTTKKESIGHLAFNTSSQGTMEVLHLFKKGAQNFKKNKVFLYKEKFK